MIRTVDLGEAEAHLEDLVEEEFILTRDGRPVARVVSIRDENPAPRIGFLPEITVPDDFDEMGGYMAIRMSGTL